MEKPLVELKQAWKEYPSIDNANGRLLKKVAPTDAQGRRWVALEKVHGANFCFITDGTDLVGARRNALLDPAETFYSWQVVRDKHAANFHTIYRLVRALPGHDDVAQVCVFGELFGGVYPHPEVPDKGQQPVQKGVYYTPDIEFYAFDIQVVRGDGGASKQWLDYDVACKLFAQCEDDFFYAKPLVTGTLAECFAFDIRINSTVPAQLGLPALDQNQMEGIVIKPVDNSVTLQRGTKHDGGGPRAIFKKKNAKFEEVNPKCETKWDQQRRLKKEAVDTVYEEVERYLTVNRLHNLESKIGPVTRANAGEAAAALALDALKDLADDYEEVWAVLEPGTLEIVHKNVRSKASQWLNDHLTSEGL